VSHLARGRPSPRGVWRCKRCLRPWDRC
jgi:hypothetical protein